MFERRRIGVDAGHVHSALVGEGIAPHVGLVGVGDEIKELVEEVCGSGQGRQLLARDALVAKLELKIGDDRHEVGVATTLAIAVHRPLHVRGAGRDRRQGVGDAASRVVVAVDPEPDAGCRQLADDRGHRDRDAIGKGAAVGVAARHRFGTGLRGHTQAGKRILVVVGKAVEEVLRVVDDPLARSDQERDRVGDHPQVLLTIDLDHLLQVQRPALADERADGREAIGQNLKCLIVLGLQVASASHPEGRDLGVLEALL